MAEKSSFLILVAVLSILFEVSLIVNAAGTKSSSSTTAATTTAAPSADAKTVTVTANTTMTTTAGTTPSTTSKPELNVIGSTIGPRKTTFPKLWEKSTKLNNIAAAAAVVTSGEDDDSGEDDSDEEKIEIDSFIYRELGCPIVAERANFDLEQFHGEWKIPFGSMNWLTDMTKAMLKRNPTVSEIKGLCPQVMVRSLVNSTKGNDTATMEIDWKCSKKKIEFMIRCWPQRNWTHSKFECFFPTINLHSFVMVAATDHTNWILLVRCKIGVDTPGEGMSWLLLSKEETVDDGILSVVFGLLEGYGFDLESFKFRYTYDSCKGDSGNVTTTTTSTTTSGPGPTSMSTSMSTSTVATTTLGPQITEITTIKS